MAKQVNAWFRAKTLITKTAKEMGQDPNSGLAPEDFRGLSDLISAQKSEDVKRLGNCDKPDIKDWLYEQVKTGAIGRNRLMRQDALQKLRAGKKMPLRKLKRLLKQLGVKSKKKKTRKKKRVWRGYPDGSKKSDPPMFFPFLHDD